MCADAAMPDPAMVKVSRLISVVIFNRDDDETKCLMEVQWLYNQYKQARNMTQ